MTPDALEESDRRYLAELRKAFHKDPELSGQEEKTAERVGSLLTELGADSVVSGIGGYGVAGVFEGKAEGPTILFRCELDALPIAEVGDLPHRSRREGVGHKCGHDGHMAILLGLGMTLRDERPERGRTILVFQPAEETGEGAARVIADPKYREFAPDKAFALHNLPGYPEGAVVVKDGIFASASRGMEIKLKGKTAHAGEPWNGKSPSNAMAGIVQGLESLPEEGSFSDFTLVTVVHVNLGAIAYGTAPGYAEVRATLRAHRDDDLEKLTEKAEELVHEWGAKAGLEVEIAYTEEFFSTAGDRASVDTVRKAGKEAGAELIELEAPFKWCEDFNHFTNAHGGALFGLGAGVQTPQLHNPDYDFPDAVIPTGVAVFRNILEAITEKG